MSNSTEVNKESFNSQASKEFFESKFESPQKKTPPSSKPVKILPTYIFDAQRPKAIIPKLETKKSTPTKNSSGNSSNRIKSAGKKTPLKKSIRRSTSFLIKPKTTPSLSEYPNFQYELEKLIRAVYRHCVVCPELKSELLRTNANVLLDYYAQTRLQEN